jgi:hypothetical protein
MNMFQRLLDFLDPQTHHNQEDSSMDHNSPAPGHALNITAKDHLTDKPRRKVTLKSLEVSNGDTLVLERFKDSSSEQTIEWSSFVGEAIRELRLTLKPGPITQEELARRAAAELRASDGFIDQAYVSRVEGGKIQPSLKRLRVFAHALGTSVSRIIWYAERAAASCMMQA